MVIDISDNIVSKRKASENSFPSKTIDISSSDKEEDFYDIKEEKIVSSSSKRPFEDQDADKLEDLLERERELSEQIEKLRDEIKQIEKDMGIEDIEPKDEENFRAPEYCVPIKANVMDFEWDKLASACQFDAILMDPPWQLASQAPTRGVAIAYQQLPDVCIESLPIAKLQNEGGFLFIWVINNKFSKALELFNLWGYTFVDDITWVKQTVNRRMAKGHGYYLQHAKETCLVGVKKRSGVVSEYQYNSSVHHPKYPSKTQPESEYQNEFTDSDDIYEPYNLQYNIGSDVIFSERRGQSQKPEELYEMIEQFIPGGRYLEIFGRKNNLRDYWVTIGNEL
ncbi:hypothetical protein BB559_003064 [Furculomyces boomerangus]|uniref:mRNA m(6)A methyltransferase n=2 Tax=Harpellales TaxID=61421 RepID=A0A2T9YPB2_9FUNG|nr:hypothetical protein BB559_003064 [Furculomyces boomerangus]PVZ96588.1 hypothetical protein BB558_007495 [Smittium angustum]PVZ97318.1 hypothetical protein BB558_006727 [Smittium angustum]